MQYFSMLIVITGITNNIVFFAPVYILIIPTAQWKLGGGGGGEFSSVVYDLKYILHVLDLWSIGFV